MMKQSEYVLLSRSAPVAWIGAILFFLAVECLVLAAEMHGLSALSLARRVSLPAALVGPLAVGGGLARLIKRQSELTHESEIGRLSIACVALLTLMIYVILTGTVSMFL
jgi:hypothetical protein